MLTIRKEQLDAFRTANRDRNIACLADSARLLYAPQFEGMPDEKVRLYCSRLSAAADQYGIQHIGDLLLFLKLSVLYGEDFHRESWANCVLRSKAHGPDKLAFLAGWLEQKNANL
jgi:hypothetical protein